MWFTSPPPLPVKSMRRMGSSNFCRGIYTEEEAMYQPHGTTRTVRRRGRRTWEDLRRLPPPSVGRQGSKGLFPLPKMLVILSFLSVTLPQMSMALSASSLAGSHPSVPSALKKKDVPPTCFTGPSRFRRRTRVSFSSRGYELVQSAAVGRLSMSLSSYARQRNDVDVKFNNGEQHGASAMASAAAGVDHDRGTAPNAANAFEGPAVGAAGAAIRIREVDVRYDSKSNLIYDPTVRRFVVNSYQPGSDEDHASTDGHWGDDGLESSSDEIIQSRRRPPSLLGSARRRIHQILRSAFIPEGVSSDYYHFMKWRIIQRFINANVHVFGTQSLLLGLGLKTKHSLGLSAALNWVLKDALGKITRMVWASKMGRKFDSDAKRWRFRSSLWFATGNLLEVVTYINPSLFLVWATTANCLKQMSMLTSSATRNAIYNSFRVGKRENIGDITAKGEAQIAVVDLLGITSGVCLSRAIGTGVINVLGVFAVLQVAEICCMYREIRSVVFHMMNFERLWGIAEHVVDEMGGKNRQQQQEAKVLVDGDVGVGGVASDSGGGVKNDDGRDVNATATDPSTTPKLELLRQVEELMPTPQEVARQEKIFLPPCHLGRRPTAFGSVGRASLDPDELNMLLNDVFAGEKYFLVVGANAKHSKRQRLWRFATGRHRRRRGQDGEEESRKVLRRATVREDCHIVLHSEASNTDIVKSILALACLRRNLVRAVDNGDDGDAYADGDGEIRSRNCMGQILEAREEADMLFPIFLRAMQKRGWNPSRYMFGRVHMRAEWPLQRPSSSSRPGGDAKKEAKGAEEVQEGRI